MAAETVHAADSLVAHHVHLIGELAEEIGKTEYLVEKKRELLTDAMLDAYEAGVPGSEIYEAAGMSKQRMHQLLAKARARRDKKGGRR